MRLLLGLVSALLVWSCARAADGPETACGPCGSGEVCDPAAGRCREALPDRCGPGTSWQPGVVAFREATSRWGLDALGVEGVRLSVADVDGDSFADLFARRAGSSVDDFSEGGARAHWLLRNVNGERFEDVTERSGIVAPRHGGPPRNAEVAVFADLDGDGHVDAFTGTSRTSPPGPEDESSEILLNDGTGRFVLGPADAAPRRERSVGAIGGAAFVDVDRDGVVDLFVGHGAVRGAPQQDRLYRGLDDGRFEEITALAGLETEGWRDVKAVDEARGHSNAWGVLACDLNDDGRPELLVSSYGRAPNHLWQAKSDEPWYENRSIESGYAFDHREDWTDNESARCFCLLHPAAEDCEGASAPEHIRCDGEADAFRWNHETDRNPYRLGGNSGTTLCADVNGDGAMDLLTTEIVHWDVGSSSDPSELLLNRGDADVAFDRPGNERTGLTRVRDAVDWNDGDMTAATFDFDNDGRPDVYIGSSDYPGTRGHLYRQREDGTFVELPLDEGIDHRSSHGIAVADFDRDGDLDVAVGHSRTRCEGGDHCYEKATVRLFENVIGQDGNWIQLALRGGPGTNRLAIGARIEVRAAGRLQVQEIGGGHGHYGIQHDLVAHFGLGAACEAEVTIRWPDRALTTQRFTVQAGYRYRVEQGGLPAAIR
ncbi:MAG TPA: CRTAC1 family protein [Vulgatibacter sp.]|nr:CRTAC1 family protein [Vulgatibacter sp.]